MTITQNKKVEFRELGLKEYAEAFDYQQNLMDEIIAQKIRNRDNEEAEPEITPNYLLFVEHPHCLLYTSRCV